MAIKDRDMSYSPLDGSVCHDLLPAKLSATLAAAPADLGYAPQMAGDEVVRRVAIVMLAPTLGVRVFFLARPHR
jgi:hypothetical protein